MANFVIVPFKLRFVKVLAIAISLTLASLTIRALPVHAEPVTNTSIQVDTPLQFYYNQMTDQQRHFVNQYADVIKIAGQVDTSSLQYGYYGYTLPSVPKTIFLNPSMFTSHDDYTTARAVNTMLHEALHLKARLESNGTTGGEHIDIYRDVINLTTENQIENDLAIVDYRFEQFSLQGCYLSVYVPRQDGFMYFANCNGQIIRF